MSNIVQFPDRGARDLADRKREIDVAMRARGFPAPARQEFIAWLLERSGGTLQHNLPPREDIVSKARELLNAAGSRTTAG